MPLPLYQVDAFTDRPFAGNPAAVCLLPAPRDAAFLQSVATEMNLAETAFLVRRGATPADGWGLRCFTPAVEVALCGHATLASAHVLWQRGDWIVLDFPAEPPAEMPEPPPVLQEVLGAELLWVGRNRFDYFALLRDAAAVDALAP